ncbi:MAG: hypothetical protein NVS1B1_06540 [Candidatus Limnocylindrales bacterium]
MHRILAGSLVGTSVAFTVAALVIFATSRDLPLPDSWGFRTFPTIFAATFTSVGAALAWWRPRNSVGWLLLIFGVLSAVQAGVTEYSIYGVIGRSDPLPGGVFAGWVGSWMWLSEVVGITCLLPLLFPNGRFLSPRWRAAAWLGGASAVVAAAALSINAGPLNNAPWVTNPFGFIDGYAIMYPAMAGVAASSVAASASLFVRYRRSRGVERQQLKWFAFEAIILAVAVMVGSFEQVDKWTSVFLIGAIALTPVVIGIAIFRYHLYDIDILINRAIVYGLTSAAIAASFFLGIVVLQAPLRAVTGGSEIAVAGSTLACFALFQPLRARIQETVDRRFYRSRYDAVRTLDTFSARLRDEVDLDAVRRDLVEAVRDTVQPVHASIWLRGPAR